MKTPSRATVEKIRKEYPVGTQVVLVCMDDILSRILDKGSYQYF